MRANNSQINLNSDRQKEYQRQQEKLKALPSTADKVKPVSADLMIENLLKDTYLKTSPMSQPGNNFKPVHFDLPPWLQCDSSLVPEHYQFLWSLVQSSVDMADTQKVSQLLLTSGLHVDVLGFIWNLANKTIPGKLTKQEFYIVLALITLAQTGYAFNNLSVLKLIPVPIPSPALQVNVLKKFLPQTYVNTPLENSSPICPQAQNNKMQESISLISADSVKRNMNTEVHRPSTSSNNILNTVVETKSKPKNVNSNSLSFNSDVVKNVNTLKVNDELFPNFPCIGSSPTAELQDEFTDFQSVPAENSKDLKQEDHIDPNDDFSEFQSGVVEHVVDPFETVVIKQKKDIPKIPLPKSFSGRLPSLKSDILKISPESERKLKVLSQSESLSSLPESKISSTNKVSTSISVLGSNHDIGSRLANHSLNVKLDKPKFHKHHKIKINPNPPNHSAGDGEIIFGVKTSNLEHVIPKCCPKKPSNGKTFLLKETKITNESGSDRENVDSMMIGDVDPSSAHSGKNTRKIEIPMLGTFNETTLPTQTQSQAPAIDFISIQEDKYSALRELELHANQDLIIPKPKEENDEFGDFLSADIPQPSFPLPNTLDKPFSVSDSNEPITNVKKITEELVPRNDDNEGWSDWNFSVEPKSENTISTCNNPTNINNESLVLNDKQSTTKAAADVFDSFNLLGDDDVIIPPTTILSTETLSHSDILSNPDAGSLFSVTTLSPIKENAKVIKEEEEELDLKPSEASNFDLFSLQSALPQINSDARTEGDNDDENWDFFSAPPQPEPSNLSRQGSLPSLDLKMTNEETEQEVIWRKCYESCRNIIQEANEIFNGVTKKSVLDEIFANPKTSEYLNDLNIAYQIIERIKNNSGEAFSSQDDELDKHWARLKELCFEYNIKLKEEIYFSPKEKQVCTICQGTIGEDLHNENNRSYHLSCANLWINCVEETLPAPT